MLVLYIYFNQLGHPFKALMLATILNLKTESGRKYFSILGHSCR